MDGWGKIATGVVLGVAGTVYATNRRVRERLPEAARDLPDNVRDRFKSAVSAAREASEVRRQEILRNLEERAASHPPRPEAVVPPRPESSAVSVPEDPDVDRDVVKTVDDETRPPSPS